MRKLNSLYWRAIYLALALAALAAAAGAYDTWPGGGP